MSLLLDDLDLVKRTEQSATSKVLEIRAIHAIYVSNKRNLVELDIPGSLGNVLQDMGAGPVVISIFGEIFGEQAIKTYEKIQQKYAANTPIDFSSEIANMTEIAKVIIEEFYIEEVAGSTERFKYHMTLREYREPSESKQEKTPEKEKQSANEEVDKESEIWDIRGRLVDEDGNPAKGLRISVKGPNGEFSLVTNGDGVYELDGTDLSEGKYVITCKDRGYEDYYSEVEIKKKDKA